MGHPVLLSTLVLVLVLVRQLQILTTTTATIVTATSSDFDGGDGEDLVHNCTIFLGSLDVRNIHDQCICPSIKEKDHLVG